jgi:hypothetical protein
MSWAHLLRRNSASDAHSFPSSTGLPRSVALGRVSVELLFGDSDFRGVGNKKDIWVLVYPPSSCWSPATHLKPRIHMRVKNRLKIAAVMSPLLLLGVMVAPAQALARSSTCTKTDSSGTYTGTILFSSQTTPVVSYRIVTHVSGKRGIAAVSDRGTNPVRTYSTGSALQDGNWHAIQGPYSRTANRSVTYSFTFATPQNTYGPSCGLTFTV